MKLSIVVFIASFLVVVSGQNPNLCGRNLATALANLCDMNMVKRARGDTLARGQDTLARELGGLQYWPWMTRHRSRSLGVRSKRQIVSECCEKACTNDELLSYCDY